MILIWFRGSMTGIKNESLCLAMQQIHLANMLCCKREKKILMQFKLHVKPGKKTTNTTSINQKIRGKKREIKKCSNSDVSVLNFTKLISVM